MRLVLEYFDPAIQSEIKMMLKFVQTDESLYSMYVNALEALPSKRELARAEPALKMFIYIGCKGGYCSFSRSW
jgi:hypothetical protein